MWPRMYDYQTRRALAGVWGFEICTLRDQYVQLISGVCGQHANHVLLEQCLLCLWPPLAAVYSVRCLLMVRLYACAVGACRPVRLLPMQFWYTVQAVHVPIPGCCSSTVHFVTMCVCGSMALHGGHASLGAHCPARRNTVRKEACQAHILRCSLLSVPSFAVSSIYICNADTACSQQMDSADGYITLLLVVAVHGLAKLLGCLRLAMFPAVPDSGAPRS